MRRLANRNIARRDSVDIIQQQREKVRCRTSESRDRLPRFGFARLLSAALSVVKRARFFAPEHRLANGSDAITPAKRATGRVQCQKILKRAHRQQASGQYQLWFGGWDSCSVCGIHMFDSPHFRCRSCVCWALRS